MLGAKKVIDGKRTASREVVSRVMGGDSPRARKVADYETMDTRSDRPFVGGSGLRST